MYYHAKFLPGFCGAPARVPGRHSQSIAMASRDPALTLPGSLSPAMFVWGSSNSLGFHREEKMLRGGKGLKDEETLFNQIVSREKGFVCGGGWEDGHEV